MPLLMAFAGATTVFGCASNWKTLPADGSLDEQAVITAVDSELARYYLQRGSQEGGDEEMELAIAKARALIGDAVPDRAALRRLSQEYSTDFASLVLVARLQSQPANVEARKIFEKHLAALRKGSERDAPAGGLYIVFAPGWFYRSVPSTGADFWRQRRLLERYGVETRLVATGENDTVEDNAGVIARELAALGRTHEKIVVVSTSKSGPEVLLALSLLEERGEAGAVVAWVNIGGVLRGSLLADLAVSPGARLLVKTFMLGGRSMEGVESLTTERSEERVARAVLPERLLVLNYIAVPLSGQISERAKQGYAILRSEGPNDGHTLIADEILPGSLSIVELGLDHYYDDPKIDLKTLALTRTVVDLLDARNQCLGAAGAAPSVLSCSES